MQEYTEDNESWYASFIFRNSSPDIDKLHSKQKNTYFWFHSWDS